MNPADIRFMAIEAPANSCRNCVFKDEDYRACVHAADLAVQRGMPDCDDKAPSGKTYIYVLDGSDPRQLDMLKEH